MTQAWYPFYWSDYSSKTMHLTMGQHGAFMMLLRWIYTTEKPIPNKQRYSIARAMSEQEQSDVDLVLEQFFEQQGEGWVSGRALEVIETAKTKHEARVNAGKRGGLAKSSNAKAMPKQSSTNHNHNHNHTDTNVSDITIGGSDGVIFDMPFQELWQTYLGIGKHGDLSPGYKGSKKYAQSAYFKILKSTKENEREALIRNIADGARRYGDFLKRAEQRCQHVSTWLNASGWETDYGTDDQAGPAVRSGPGRGERPGYSHSIFDASRSAKEAVRAADERR